MDKKKNRHDVETCSRYIYSSKEFNDTGIHKITRKFRQNSELRQAVWNYTSGNVAVVHVYFKDINVERHVRKEAYTISAFMAAVGGLLGLAMGVSFVTFFEASYMILRVALILVFHAVAHCCNRHEGGRSSHEGSSTGSGNKDKYL